jgi:hypothetical protein
MAKIARGDEVGNKRTHAAQDATGMQEQGVEAAIRAVVKGWIFLDLGGGDSLS